MENSGQKFVAITFGLESLKYVFEPKNSFLWLRTTLFFHRLKAHRIFKRKLSSLRIHFIDEGIKIKIIKNIKMNLGLYLFEDSICLISP